MNRRRLGVLLLALALPGCPATGTGRLRPLAGEGVALLDEGAAAVGSAGVTLVAAVERWQYHPRAVNELYRPIHVTLYNRGDAPVEVNRDDFALRDAQQTVHAAAPPKQVLYRDFGDARPRLRIGVGFDVPFTRGCDPLWGCGGLTASVHGRAVDDAPPDLAMRQSIVDLALAEGVLPPGKKTQGFLYFERTDPGQHLDLCWDVWAERGERPRTTLCLRFEVR